MEVAEKIGFARFRSFRKANVALDEGAKLPAKNELHGIKKMVAGVYSTVLGNTKFKSQLIAAASRLFSVYKSCKLTNVTE